MGSLATTKRLALGDLRVAGALMLAAGVAKSAMHVHAGVPCPLRTVTGIPCPLCGMTTSVTAAVHGDLGAAIAANPAGPLLVVAVVALLAIRHRDSIDVPRWSLPVALALMWVWELARFNLI